MPVTGLGTLAVADATVGQGLEGPVAITFTPVVGPTAGAVNVSRWPGRPRLLDDHFQQPESYLARCRIWREYCLVYHPSSAGTGTISVGVEAVGTAPAGTTLTISFFPRLRQWDCHDNVRQLRIRGFGAEWNWRDFSRRSKRCKPV